MFENLGRHNRSAEIARRKALNRMLVRYCLKAFHYLCTKDGEKLVTTGYFHRLALFFD